MVLEYGHMRLSHTVVLFIIKTLISIRTATLRTGPLNNIHVETLISIRTATQISMYAATLISIRTAAPNQYRCCNPNQYLY